MASIDNALTTVARAKSFLGISGAAKDFVLTMLILAASKYIESTYCRRKFKHQTFTNEVYSGKNGKRLWLKNKPITDGSTVTLQKRSTSNNEDDWQTVPSDQYFINREAGNLELIRFNDAWLGLGGDFQAGVQNYRVTYTAGYYLPSESEYQDGTDDDKDLPYDLELAVLDLLGAVYNARQAAGIESQKVMDVSITYGKEVDKHPTLKATLDKYKATAYA